MKKVLQVVNPIVLLLTIITNYLAASGFISGTTVGEMSAKYSTFFTPAGYAFSIWGLIYLMLVGFVIYQAIGLFKKVQNDAFILQIGGWFVMTCIFNCLWLITWVSGLIGLSVLLMILLLISLLKIVVNTNMEKWEAPLPVIAFVWWPFCIYAGWITVALIANIAAFLTKIGWNGFGWSEVTWTVVMIIVAGIINLAITWTRNMREFALVGVWALIAIAVANWGDVQVIVYTAMATAAILLISSGIHGFQNRKSNSYLRNVKN